MPTHSVPIMALWSGLLPGSTVLRVAALNCAPYSGLEAKNRTLSSIVIRMRVFGTQLNRFFPALFLPNVQLTPPFPHYPLPLYHHKSLLTLSSSTTSRILSCIFLPKNLALAR